MRGWMYCVFALILLCRPTLAQTTHDGNELSEECSVALRSIEHPTSTDGIEMGLCFGMVDGIMETQELWSAVDSQHREAMYHGCIPSEVTVGEAVKVVMKFLNDNPNRLHQKDTFLIGIALAKAYPCPASPGTTK